MKTRIIPNGGATWFVECWEDNAWRRAATINYPGNMPDTPFGAYLWHGQGSGHFATLQEAVEFAASQYQGAPRILRAQARMVETDDLD